MDVPGSRSLPSGPPVPQELLDGFRDAAVANVSDNLGRLYGTRALRPFHPGGRVIGTALTIKTRPGDNLAIHAAYEILRPGDVLVIDGGGDLNQGLVGEIMMSRAKGMGAAGFVIDGAVRDVAAFAKADFPCFARGVTHRGPYKSGPGEINVPVSIDGMVVMPGDLIIGDEDGVLAIDRAYASELLARTRQQADREAGALAAIAEGRLDSSYIGTGGVTDAKR